MTTATQFKGFNGVKYSNKNKVAKSKQVVLATEVVKSMKSQVLEKVLGDKEVRVHTPTKSKDTKTYKTAGVSILNGVMKVRFANALEKRIKVLKANDHTDIRLVEVEAGTKVEVARQLLTHVEFQDKWAQETIQNFLNKNA